MRTKMVLLGWLTLGLVALIPARSGADTTVAKICVQETSASTGRTRASLFVTTADVTDPEERLFYKITGKLLQVDEANVRQPVIGSLFVTGNQVTCGYEGFPTPGFPIAVKGGGTFSLNTLTGSFHSFRFAGPPTGTLIRTGSTTVNPGLCSDDAL